MGPEPAPRRRCDKTDYRSSCALVGSSFRMTRTAQDRWFGSSVRVTPVTSARTTSRTSGHFRWTFCNATNLEMASRKGTPVAT